MKKRASLFLLGLFDLLLFAGATWFGILMLTAARDFDTYPAEWLGRMPFTSWLPIGMLAIAVFGLGNLLAAVFTIEGHDRRSALCSAVLGALLILGITAQYLAVGAMYLPGAEFILLGFLQIGLAGIVMLPGFASRNHKLQRRSVK